MTILHGDCLEVMAAMEPNSVDLRGGLNCRVSLAVTGITERNEVGKIIRADRIGKESKWADVMNRLTGCTAMLTGLIVAFQRRSSLRLPVRSTFGSWSTEVLRMKRTYAIQVTAGTRAKLTLAAIVLRMTGRSFIFLSAPQARQQNLSTKPIRYRNVLARRRTRTSSPMLETGRDNLKCLSAGLANSVNFHASMIKQGVGR